MDIKCLEKINVGQKEQGYTAGRDFYGTLKGLLDINGIQLRFRQNIREKQKENDRSESVYKPP